VLSTARFRALADAGQARVRAGAGVTLVEIGVWLRARGAIYPPGPTFLGATVGGTVATNAAGAATFKYGTTRAWIDAVTIVLATGDVLDVHRGECVAHPEGYFDIELAAGITRIPIPQYTMPNVPKLSAGYWAAPGMDLVDLFIGAEGTLGVVTEATLRSHSPAPASCLVFVTFRERARALAFVTAVRDAALDTWRTREPSGLDVSAIEHMDARSLSLLREDGVDRRLGITLDAQAVMGLLVTIDLPPGTSSSSVYESFTAEAGSGSSSSGNPLARFAALLEEFGADGDAVIAPPDDAAGIERLVALREAVPVAVNARVGRARRDIDAKIEKTAADVIVPFDRFGELLDVYEHEWRRLGLDGAIWGHISDGNVHPNVIPRSFADVVSGREAALMFGREAIRLGGAPMAEHGVGRNSTKQQLLLDLYGTQGLEQMRAVKRALDPESKLAPGVLFPVR
jgi:D-lactate dehydrogenase (cytochrome)